MIVEILLFLLLLWFTLYGIKTFLERRKMPPGPFPYPFIGNIPQMMCDPINPFSKLAEKYGNIFTVTFPIGNAVVLNTASLVREARIERKDDIVGRLPEFLYPVDELMANGVFTTDYSPVYKFRKRVFVSALHIFGSGINHVSERSRNAVEIAMKEIDSKEGHPFSPRKLLDASILVQLWDWLTSNKVSLTDPVIKHISELNDIIAKQAYVATVYQWLPVVSQLPTQFRRDVERARQLKEMVFPPAFRAHMKSYTPGIIRDLIDSFISSYEKEIAKEKRKDIGSIEDIPGLMLNVAVSGSDTTSTSLSWLLLYMVLHSNLQEKIHEELDFVVGRHRLPNWKDAQDMPYLQAALCEAQRASGMMVVVGSNAVCDTTISGYHIPKGTYVALNLSKLHRDEQEWPEPKIFKSERFLDCNGNFVGWNKLHGFLPFGIGRRECPGQSLARIMMFTFAAVLFHRYKFELPEGAETPSTEAFYSAIILPPKDFEIIAQRRI